MFCKNCGAEIQEGDKFCGKCGYQLEDFNKKKTISIRLHHFIVGLIIILIVIGALGAYIINKSKTNNYQIENVNSSNNITQTDKTDKENTNSNINKNIETSKKEYYKFIDEEYGTFDFTENELINIITGGYTYSQAGLRKTASSNESNTNIYYSTANAEGFSGIESIIITTDTSNYKVKKFSFSFVSNNDLTNESSMTLLNAYLTQGCANLLGKKAQNMTSSEMTQVDNMIAEWSNNKTSNVNKGVIYTPERNLRSVKATFSASK